MGFDTFDMLGGSSTAATITSDGTAGGNAAPRMGHGATVVAIIVVLALALLIFGVIGLRASGEVVL